MTISKKDGSTSTKMMHIYPYKQILIEEMLSSIIERNITFLQIKFVLLFYNIQNKNYEDFLKATLISSFLRESQPNHSLRSHNIIAPEY